MFWRGSIISVSGNLKGFLCHLCQLCFFKAQRWLPTTTKKYAPGKTKILQKWYFSCSHVSETYFFGFLGPKILPDVIFMANKPELAEKNGF